MRCVIIHSDELPILRTMTSNGLLPYYTSLRMTLRNRVRKWLGCNVEVRVMLSQAYIYLTCVNINDEYRKRIYQLLQRISSVGYLCYSCDRKHFILASDMNVYLVDFQFLLSIHNDTIDAFNRYNETRLTSLSQCNAYIANNL